MSQRDLLRQAKREGKLRRELILYVRSFFSVFCRGKAVISYSKLIIIAVVNIIFTYFNVKTICRIESKR